VRPGWQGAGQLPHRGEAVVVVQIENVDNRRAAIDRDLNPPCVAAEPRAQVEIVLRGARETDRDLARVLRVAGRATPDVTFQSGALATGITRVQLSSNFLNSQEFRISTGPRLTAFLLSACLLQRDPTAVERASLISQVSGGAAVRDLINTIVN